jgi:hypothetical protein
MTAILTLNKYIHQPLVGSSRFADSFWAISPPYFLFPINALSYSELRCRFTARVRAIFVPERENSRLKGHAYVWERRSGDGAAWPARKSKILLVADSRFILIDAPR